MRAPGRGTSFREVITVFLQQQEALNRSQKEFLQQLHYDDTNRLDEIWRRFVEKQPKLTDEDRAEFINYLMTVWAIVDLSRYEFAEKRLRKLHVKLRARLKQFWAQRFIDAPPDELPKIIKEMTWFIGNDESEPSNNFFDAFPELDIRSDHEGSRLRTGFMRFMSLRRGLLGIGAMTKSLP